jgi:hypothetical protein
MATPHPSCDYCGESIRTCLIWPVYIAGSGRLAGDGHDRIRADPDLADEELAEAMQALDTPAMAEALAREFSAEQVRGIRAAFAGWPRPAEAQADRRDREAGA